jgi:predicted lipoprotein with Yx(FWY)xxD motif
MAGLARREFEEGNVKTNHRMPRRGAGVGRLVAVGVALAALGVAGWGAVPAGAAQKPITISAVKTPKNGTVLVGGHTTLYTLQPSSTPCDSACLKIWPAVMLAPGQTNPIAGHGVKASSLATVSANGGLQVTYNGQPLFWYSGDKKSGQVKGNFSDTWGKWTAVVTSKAASSSSGSSGSNSGSGGASF